MTYDRAFVAQNIHSRRTALGMPQQAVADALGVSVMTVSRFERGSRTPSVARLCELAAALECTPNELLSGADPEPLVNVLKDES